MSDENHLCRELPVTLLALAAIVKQFVKTGEVDSEIPLATRFIKRFPQQQSGHRFGGTIAQWSEEVATALNCH